MHKFISQSQNYDVVFTKWWNEVFFFTRISFRNFHFTQQNYLMTNSK